MDKGVLYTVMYAVFRLANQVLYQITLHIM